LLRKNEAAGEATYPLVESVDNELTLGPSYQ
jgi:hypothetical protein